MLAICVDDEQMALEALKCELRKEPRVKLLAMFRSPEQALSYVRQNAVDIAFLDIHMRGGNGLELASRIRSVSPRTRIIFTTGYSEYALQAIHMHVAGYLIKPVTADDIAYELDALESPPVSIGNTAVLRVQCFGNFEVFRDETPLKFKRQRSKELFAYLVDRRGAAVSTGEMCSTLWPDKPDGVSQRAQLRALTADIINTLRENGAQNAIDKNRGRLSVVAEYLDCDYYKLLSGDVQAINSYHGEYMAQYEWSELTIAALPPD